MRKRLTVAESAVSRVRTRNFITPPSGGFFGTPPKPTSTPLRISLGGVFLCARVSSDVRDTGFARGEEALFEPTLRAI